MKNLHIYQLIILNQIQVILDHLLNNLLSIQNTNQKNTQISNQIINLKMPQELQMDIVNIEV